MGWVRVTVLLLGLPALGAAAQTTTSDRWSEDLRTLVETLESEHANLYHTVSQAAFRAGINSLAAQAGSLNDSTIIAELARLVATIGDGHTEVKLPFLRRLPVVFERAADGLVILEVSSDFTDLLGARVIRLGQRSADDALAAVRPLYSRDNEWTSLGATDLLQIPEILHATGITQSADSVELEVETRSGELRVVTLAAVTREALGPLNVSISADTAPLWLRNRENRYWLALLAERRAVYVQFNGADWDKEEESLAEFGPRMEQTVRDHDVDRLILDLRWNDGGSRWRARHLLNAVIRVEGYFRAERATRERQPSGRIFTIIGPRTFSAATQFALDLDLHTNTLFVGEPTGGKPNHYGELGRAPRLPNSRLEVRFSQYYHQESHPRDTRPAIFPDVTALPSIDDYRTGRDRALEAIWSYRRP